jgi:endonuclease YncB( thermonuclease family)
MPIWIKIIFFSLNLLLISTTFAFEDVKISKVISVYDADTIRVNIDSFPDIIGKNIRIRLKGIDAPEIKGMCQKEIDLAIMARDYLRNAINQSSRIELRNIERGKYFRIVGELYIDGENISNNLLKRKLAYYYNGAKKRSWCY